jgi:arylsulfatase A-like enzyme
MARCAVPASRWFGSILLATAALLARGESPAFAAPSPLPNAIVVLADQWRAQAFGYAGDPNVRTLNLDRLEHESIDFTNAVSNIPVCTPTRASILTGQRALTHGLFMNDAPLNPRATTIAKVLGAAGYDTGYIGKWHVDGHGRSAFIPPERRQGFEYWKVLECTHDYNHSFYYADGPEKLQWDGYDAIAQTRDATQYVRGHAGRAKPFVLFLAWGPPHDPYQTAPKEYRELYDPQKLEPRPNVPAALRDQVRKRLAGYYAHCTALDACLGDLWQACRDAGVERNTVLLFTADHGDLLGSHGAYNKQQPYEESVRVPLLVHWPDRFGRAGRRLPAPINTEDIMPTLLDLCGVAVPPTVQGTSFAGYMAGGKDPSDDASLILCPAPFGQWNRLLGGREYRAVRTARYTYARDLKGPWLLFDNERDSGQMDNLIDRPEHAALQEEMERQLQRKLKQTDDEFLPARHYIEKWGYHTDANGTIPYTN